MTTRREFLVKAGAAGTIGALTIGAPIFTVPAAAQNAVQLALFGDYGNKSAAENAVAQMVDSWKPDAVFTMGDNVYSSSTADPHDVLQNHALTYYQRFVNEGRFFPSLGNHDWGDPGVPLLQVDGSGVTSGAWRDLLNLPGNGRYYDVRLGPLHVFVLDDHRFEPDGHTASSLQAAWLRDSAAASDAVWKIVVHHYPPVNSPKGGRASIQWPFEQWGIDASFSGHYHNYERVERGNMLYIVNGLGGVLPEYPGTPIADSKKIIDDSHGAVRLVASSSEMRVEFVDTNGTVRDSVTRTVGPPPPPNPYEPSPFTINIPEPYISATGIGGTIARMYLATHNRIPDPGGYEYWINLNQPLLGIANFFAGSPEFLERYGSLDNEGFVTRMYLNVLGRIPEPAGLASWLATMESGVSRGFVLLGFGESEEFRQRTGILG